MQRGDEGAAAAGESSHETPPERLEFALRAAADLDELTRVSLAHLVSLPGVSQAGLALTEGAGRRLRYASADRRHQPDLAWCHIDAYDDVPLTTVARTGQPVLGAFDGLGSRYRDFLAHRSGLGDCALAALPLPGTSSPLGGIIVYYASVPAFSADERRSLDAAARRIAEGVRRVRAAGQGATHEPATVVEDHPYQATLALDADPRAAGAARRFVRDRFQAWQVDDDVVETATLCISELVNNVIMHARTSSRLTLSREERQVTVMLRDLGGAAGAGQEPTHRPVDDTDEFRVFGRGLTLVDALADDWGSHRDQIGTTAWFVCRLPADADDVSRTG